MTKRFHFSLNTLGKVRAYKKQKAETEFAIAMTEYNKGLEKLKEEKDSLFGLIDYKNKITSKATPSDYKMADSMIFVTRNRVKLIEKDVDNLMEILNEKRVNLIENSKEHKIIEKLKEKSKDRYKKYLNKEQSKYFDEISSNMLRNKHEEKKQ